MSVLVCMSCSGHNHTCSTPVTRVLLLVLALLSCEQLTAQPDALVTQLLFEAVPLPAEGSAPERTLVSFSDARAEVPVPAVEAVLSSPAKKAAIEAEIAQYRARVGDSEATEGPYSSDLREDLFTTGKLYQQINDHANALQLMQRALSVSRINFGLQGLDQVPIMEAMAQSYKAQGKTGDADAMMTAALNLQLDVYGANSIEVVPALLAMGQWNTDAFMERSSILLNIPRMNVQNFLTDPKNYIAPQIDIHSTPVFNLYQARSNYLTALKNLNDAKAFDHPDLLPLEQKLLANYFLYTHREDILYAPDFYLTRKKSKTSTRLNQNAIELLNSEDYDLGRESHKRILSYLYHDPHVSGDKVARALLEEADWDLLFQRKAKAADKYEALYRFFADNPALAQEAQAQLYPAIPPVLPIYLPPPNSREKLGIPANAEVNFFGYIDVSFKLNRYGKTGSIKILGKGGEVTRNMERRMNQYLRNVQFRPRFTNDKFDPGMLRLRYYIGI